MNIAVREPGPNFEPGLEGEWLSADVGNKPALFQWLWEQYEASGDGLWSFDKFLAESNAGHVHHGLAWDGGKIVASFALELMRDRDGPYVSFLYFHLRKGRLAPLVPMIVSMCFWMATGWQLIDGGAAGEARMLLKGRDGWQRLLPRFGIAIDPDGWIRERSFSDGNQRRQ